MFCTLRKEDKRMNERNDIPENKTEETGKKRKVNWNKKYTTIAVYALFVILFAVVCVFFFLNNHDFGKYASGFISVFNPIFYGMLFAYLMNRLMKKVEIYVFGFLERPGKRRLQRTLSVLVTIVTVVLVFCLFIWILIPQVMEGYKDLEGKMKFYIGSVQTWLESLDDNAGEFAEYIASAVRYINNFIDKAYELIRNVIPQIAGAAKNIVVTVKDMLLGFVFAIYFLFAKERLSAQTNKTLRALCTDRSYGSIRKVTGLVDEKFGGFLTGKILDSLFVGIICFAGCWAIGVPYYPLISIIVGACNLVPVFGPIVGIALSSFIVFIASMDVSLMFWYLLFVVLLHIFDAHFVSSKLVGEKTGLPAMWIFVSIIIMAGFFGLPGMIIAVPTFDVIRELLKEKTESKLEKKGESPDTLDYYGSEDGVALFEEQKEASEKSRIRDRDITLYVKKLFSKKKK